MEWPYPGVPAAVVAEFAGHRVAIRYECNGDLLSAFPALTAVRPAARNLPDHVLGYCAVAGCSAGLGA